MSKKTIIDLFETSVNRFGSNTFLLQKEAGEYRPTTFDQTRTLVYQLGAGLVALGVKPKENLALLSEGRNYWIISELAMFYAGAINVPLSIKLEESNDLLFRLKHSEAKMIFVSGMHLNKVRAIAKELPLLSHVIVFDRQENYEEKEIFIGELLEMGANHLSDEENKKAFLAIGQQVQNDDCATITYTSGTTADPKGVMLTHRNYTANVEQSLTLVDIDHTWRTLIILPLDHCFAHVVGFYIFLSQGASVATVDAGKSGIETLKNIPINIKEVKPHLILSVPALAKNFRKSIEGGIAAKGAVVEKLFRWGLSIAYTYNGDGDSRGKGWKKVLRPLVRLFDTVVFSKIRENFGGELKMFIGGGALLDQELQRFFYAIGIPMFQGYGLSEATPVISSNTFEKVRFGSSGRLVQPIDAKICDHEGRELPLGEKGELVIRGENVMAGYYKNEQATAETLKEGWLYTGDMGYLTPDGFLYILGRFKSLLIGSDGEKYSPEGIEEALVGNSHLIDQIMLHNNQNPYTIALIVPNAEALKRQLNHHHHAPTTDEERASAALRMIGHEIERYKGKGELAELFPQRWLPTTYMVVPEPFSDKDGLINSTMKLVRNKVEAKYITSIEYAYTAEGKDPDNARNREAIKNYIGK